MHRFFIKQEQSEAGLITILAEDAHHISRVLRLRPGDEIECVDEKEQVHLVQITEVGEVVVGKVLKTEIVSQEPPVKLTLFQALAKGDKMDWVIQKSVELGVSEVIPFSSSRTIVQLNKKQAANRQERWQRIAYEAAKQSGRTRLPQVNAPLSFSELVATLKMRKAAGELVLAAYEGEKRQGIKMLTGHPQAVSVIIGPEGGFSAGEMEELLAAGAFSLSLGPRILRTETAGLVALSLLGLKWGDLG